MGRFIKGLIFILILLFLTTFGVKNNQPVQIKYYFNITPVEIPLYAMVYILLVIGMVIGLFIGISKRFSQSRTIKSLQRENNELKISVKSLEEKQVGDGAKIESTDNSSEKESEAA